MAIDPAAGSSRRTTSFENVVLPEPVSPTTATRDPAATRTVTSVSTSPPVG